MSLNDFEEYDISEENGFLPSEPPLPRLPAQYDAWEQLLEKLNDLIKKGQLRDEVSKLPLLIVSDRWLKDKRHFQRAAIVLTFLSQGYMWCRGEEETVGVLPRQLAVPWWEVSHRLGLPPITTYATSVLWNWYLKDPKGPISLDNLGISHTYTGTHDEEWFYLISVAVEQAAVEGIRAAVDCLKAIPDNSIDRVTSGLQQVDKSLKFMTETLVRMYDKNDPQVFFDKIRPFQAGTKDLKAFKDGLVYEGVSDEPKKYGGASAGQSSTLPVFDILLGVEHEGMQKEFLDTQRWHMPREHRQFLVALGQATPLRPYVLEHRDNTALVAAYNSCLEQLGTFRSQHIIIVTRYIAIPAKNQKRGEERETLATRGTGGSDFMLFLKKVRDGTQSLLIQ